MSTTLSCHNPVLSGADAARAAAELRYAAGEPIRDLLGENPKVVKGLDRDYMTLVLHLAPAKLSGFQTCASSTEGCRNACLNASGQARIIAAGEATNSRQVKRVLRTLWLFRNRPEFMARLVREIELGNVRAAKRNLTAVYRLNATSDVRWEHIPCERNGERYANVFEAFPDVQFYDYTKHANRRVSGIANYHLTFSVADGNERQAYEAARSGLNLAVVFRSQSSIPATYTVGDLTLPTCDGDRDDLRFLDPTGSVVALYAKGYAAADLSGFVKDSDRLALPVLTAVA
jgi:hypothetical protein